MPKIVYDSDVKILSIRFKNEKSVDSDIKDDIVLDYDSKGHIVKLDIMEVNIEDLLHIAKETKAKKGTSVKEI